MTKKKPLRVLRYLRPCPDCSAELRGRELLHELTCPLQGAVERQCDADREYFVRHPGAEMYVRPISPAELQQLDHVDPGRQADTVIVARTEWGRVRSFVNGGEVNSLMLDPDSGAA